MSYGQFLNIKVCVLIALNLYFYREKGYLILCDLLRIYSFISLNTTGKNIYFAILLIFDVIKYISFLLLYFDFFVGFN